MRPDPAACVVLCLGDSYTACPGLPRDLAWPAQLERLLNAGPPARRFQVLNLGFNGQNSTSLVDELPANLEKYQPEIVVLMTGGANTWDFTGYRAFEQSDSWGARCLDRLGRIRVLKLARLVLIGFQGGTLGQEPAVPGQGPPPPAAGHPPPPVFPKTAVLRQKGHEALSGRLDYRAAERFFRQALALERCRAAKASVVLMNHPGDLPQGHWALYEQVARRHSLPFVDNKRSFEGLNKAVYYLPDGHCSQRGNARVADNARQAVLGVAPGNQVDLTPGSAEDSRS